MTERRTATRLLRVSRHALALALLPCSLSAMAGGAELFQQHCAACHGTAGVGTEGLAPPLVNAELWPRLGDRAPRYLTQVLANGLSGSITVQGVVYRGVAMPSQAHLPAKDLVQIAGYVLSTLNGVDKAVDEALVLSARAATVPHAELRKWRTGAAP